MNSQSVWYLCGSPSEVEALLIGIRGARNSLKHNVSCIYVRCFEMFSLGSEIAFYLGTEGVLFGGGVDGGGDVLIVVAVLRSEIPLDNVECLLVDRHVLNKECTYVQD